MKNHPLVSVVCTTYNQEKFIKQALDGFVMQKTNFDFEIIVHDDASTDNTSTIVKEYELRYPKLFSNIYQTENQFSKNVHIWFDVTFPLVKAKYIAICEGDDYWTDPLKLQNQVDFLEANPDYSMCFHQGTSFYEKSKKTEPFISNKNVLKGIVSPKEIIKLGGNLCPTNSIMFKKEGLTYPDLFKEAKSGDRALALLLMEKGKIHYIDKNMCVYRVHDGGISRNLNTEKLIAFKDSNIKILEKFNLFSNKKYEKIINNEISNQIRNIVVYDYKQICKKKYFKKINIKHLFLGLSRVFLNKIKNKM